MRTSTQKVKLRSKCACVCLRECVSSRVFVFVGKYGGNISVDQVPVVCARARSR